MTLINMSDKKDEHPLIYSIVDEQSNLQGYLAIDSIVNGHASGGLRIAPNLSPGEMAQLARVMTLKHGFLGLPNGGAKAGIVGDPEMPPEKKRRLLKAFGTALAPFLENRYYSPGTDMGTTQKDIKFMLALVNLSLPRKGTLVRSGLYTALTVVAAAVSAANHLGLNLSHSSAAVEGFGKVGSCVARELWKRQVRVVAISTSEGALYRDKGLDIGKLIKLYDEVGSKVVKAFEEAEQIDKSQLLELKVDFLLPCAGPYSINQNNARQVAAKIISPGANVPITSEAEEVLFQKGVLCLPDFVANCGGALGSTMEYAGLAQAFIRDFIDRKYSQMVTEVIQAAETGNISCQEYAQRIAVERFLKTKEKAERKSLGNKMFQLALGLYRKGFIPSQFVAILSPKYFEERLWE